MSRAVRVVLFSVVCGLTVQLGLRCGAPSGLARGTAPSFADPTAGVVETIFAGIDPEALRWHPAEGTSRARIRLDETVEVAAGPAASERTERGWTLEVEARVSSRDEDGFTWTLRVRGAEARGGDGARWATAVGHLRGLRATVRTGADGGLRSLSARGGRAADAAEADLAWDVLRGIAELPVWLPDQPVGPGARWKIERERDDRGLRLRTVERVDLDDRTDHGIRARWRVEGAVRGGALPGSPLLRIEARGGQLTGSGEGVWAIEGDPLGAGAFESRLSLSGEAVVALGLRVDARVEVARRWSVER